MRRVFEGVESYAGYRRFGLGVEDVDFGGGVLSVGMRWEWTDDPGVGLAEGRMKGRGLHEIGRDFL